MSKVTYAALSDLVEAANVRVTAKFRESGTVWAPAGWHNGIDLAAPAGSSIKAAADGTVIDADTTAHNDGYGNRVVLKHADGKATLYAHMIAPAAVKVGQAVKKGQVIGYVGSTGNSTGAHLHVSVIDNYDKTPNIYHKGDLLDPAEVLGWGTLKTGSAATSTAKTNGTSTAFKVGDIVRFNGTTHYVSSDGTRGTACKPGKAKVTIIAPNAEHPYHLIAESGGGSTVYGWVNVSDISPEKSIGELAEEVIRGDWGNGEDRKKRLTAAGYDYEAVRARVNALIKN